MKKILAISFSLAIFIAFSPMKVTHAQVTYQKNLFPITTDTYDLGSTSPNKEWNNLFVKNVTVSGTCTGCGGGGGGGGTGAATTSFATFGAPLFLTTSASAITYGFSGLTTTTQPTAGQLLESNGSNGVFGASTSTLSASAPLTGSFIQVGSGGSLGIQAASASQAGSMSAGDWSLLHTATTTFSAPLVYTQSTNAVTCPTCSSGSFAYPWTFNLLNTFSTSTNSTSTSEWTQGVFFSSSTVAASQFPYASSTMISATTASTSNLTVSTITSALGLFGASGVLGKYAGSSNPCTNQVPTTISALGALGGCSSINNAWWSGTQLAIANGGTNQTAFTTSGNAVYYTGNALQTAPVTSSITIPYATSTYMSFAGASSTLYFGAGLDTGCSGGNYLQFSSGRFGCGVPAGSFAFPWTVLTLNTFSTTTLATSTSYWTQGVFFSSSTVAASQFPYASSTSQTVSGYSFNGAVAIGTSTPWGLLSIASSTPTTGPLTPLLVIATSSDPTGLIFSVFSTTSIKSSYDGRIADSGARVVIGSATGTPLFASTLDQLSVAGRINTGDWSVLECPAMTTVPVNGDSTNACGALWHLQTDTATNSGGVNNDTVSGRFALSLDLTGGTGAGTGNNGVMLFTGGGLSLGSVFILPSDTPVFQGTMKIRNPQNATSSYFYVGFVNDNVSGTTFEIEPTGGCYFVASTTLANWQAECRTSFANTTTVDTGVASSTNITATGNFYRFRIEADKAATRFYLGSSTMPLRLVANITTNLPDTSIALEAAFLTSRISGGLTQGFDIGPSRVWFYSPNI